MLQEVVAQAFAGQPGSSRPGIGRFSRRPSFSALRCSWRVLSSSVQMQGRVQVKTERGIAPQETGFYKSVPLSTHKPLCPRAKALFSSSAVISGTQGFAEAVEKFRLLGSPRGIAWMAYRFTRTCGYGTSLLHGLLPSLKAGIGYHLGYRKIKRIL